jgi:hypothetical protein
MGSALQTQKEINSMRAGQTLWYLYPSPALIGTLKDVCMSMSRILSLPYILATKAALIRNKIGKGEATSYTNLRSFPISRLAHWNAPYIIHFFGYIGA